MAVGWLPPLMNCRKACFGKGGNIFNLLINKCLAFEAPAHTEIKLPQMAVCNLLVSCIIFGAFMYNAVYTEKAYLKKYPVAGMARLQLQHPVADNITHEPCNPLKEGCWANFKELASLDYCSGTTVPGQTAVPCDSDKKRCPCRFLDNFDVGYFSSKEPKAALLPTRITMLEQEMLCPDTDPGCGHRYEFLKESTQYVADAESFTLLVDHTFSVEEVALESDSRHTVGFFKLCAESKEGEKPGTIPVASTSLLLSEVGDLECARVLIKDTGAGVDQTTIDKLVELWSEAPLPKEKLDLWNAKPAIKSIEDGDIIFIDQVLKMLDIPLNGHPEEDENTTYRHEGFVIKIDINYYNWKESSRPNGLPAVYEIGFRAQTRSDFKYMGAIGERDVEGEDGTASAHPKRHVNDVHGIYFSVNQRGSFGEWSLRESVLMFIEASLYLGVGQFIVMCCCINVCLQGESADKLEEALVTEHDMEEVRELLDFRTVAMGRGDDSSLTDSE